MNYKNPTKAKEIDALLGYIENGKAEGKTLGELFAEYAELHKKAKGSVRNRYYDLLKTGERDDAFRNRFLCGRTLKAEKPLPKRTRKNFCWEYSVKKPRAFPCGKRCFPSLAATTKKCCGTRTNSAICW